jgi:hypothetical protein
MAKKGKDDHYALVSYLRPGFSLTVGVRTALLSLPASLGFRDGWLNVYLVAHPVWWLAGAALLYSVLHR